MILTECCCKVKCFLVLLVSDGRSRWPGFCQLLSARKTIYHIVSHYSKCQPKEQVCYSSMHRASGASVIRLAPALRSDLNSSSTAFYVSRPTLCEPLYACLRQSLRQSRRGIFNVCYLTVDEAWFFSYIVQTTVCHLQVIFADIRNGRQRQHKSGDPDATKNRPVMLTRAFTVCMYVFTQWLKCRPDGTIVAKLNYRPDGISLKKSAP